VNRLDRDEIVLDCRQRACHQPPNWLLGREHVVPFVSDVSRPPLKCRCNVQMLFSLSMYNDSSP